MKNFLPLITACFCIITAVTSCSKSGVTPKKIPDTIGTKTGINTTGTPGTTDMYVAGYEVNAQNQLAAVYWKNGTGVKLPGGVSTKCLARPYLFLGMMYM